MHTYTHMSNSQDMEVSEIIICLSLVGLKLMLWMVH